MNAQPKYSSPSDIRSRWKIIDGGRDKPARKIYAVCAKCLSIREEVAIEDSCRKCNPPRFAKVRFRSLEDAERYVAKWSGR